MFYSSPMLRPISSSETTDADRYNTMTYKQHEIDIQEKLDWNNRNVRLVRERGIYNQYTEGHCHTGYSAWSAGILSGTRRGSCTCLGWISIYGFSGPIYGLLRADICFEGRYTGKVWLILTENVIFQICSLWTMFRDILVIPWFSIYLPVYRPSKHISALVPRADICVLGADIRADIWKTMG